MARGTATRTDDAHLYESVARQIADLVEHGVFPAGERVPSVRELSRQQGISVSTVLAAYRLLEDRGLIEARPQSGYFVRAHAPAAAAEPDMSEPQREPTGVGVSELVMMVLQDTRRPDLIQLGAAVPNPDLLPTARLNRSLVAAARNYRVHSNVYDFPPGCLELRVQIARRSLAAGCALTPEQIVTTSGCLEAIGLCLRAVCRPGDTVAIESPAYFGVLQQIESLGLRVLEIPTHPREGISLEALRYAVETNEIRACFVMPNISNPLGGRMPDEKKRELVELLAEREIPLIEDDIDGDLDFAAERGKVAKAYDRKGLVLLCSSFSKTLAPDYRVGWVAPGRYRKVIEYLKMVTNVATPTLPQLAIADFLATGGYDHHLRRIRAIYDRQVAQMATAVCRFFPEGTRITRPVGGFVLWVELPAGTDSLRLYEQALKAGITFAPGPIFSAKQKYRNFLRLNAAYWSQQVEQGLATLGELATGLRPS